MKPTPWRNIVCGLTFVCLFVGIVTTCGVTSAQRKKSRTRKSAKSKKKSKTSAGLRSIEVRIQKAQTAFIREAAEAAREYEQAEEYERAKTMLRSILRLNPKITGVKEKIKQLSDKQLRQNLTDFTVDVSRGWNKALVKVFKGRPIRLQAEGRYKLITSLQIGPKGVPTANPVKGDMVTGIPAGALMGIIASRGKTGKPFLVGLGGAFTPKDDGLLFLSINAPAGHRSTGKIKVKISGTVAKP